MWNALLEAIEKRPAMSWVARSTVLQKIDQQVVHLGQRQNLTFMTDGQRQQLEELVSSVLGRRVRVEFGPLQQGGSDRPQAAATGPAAPQRPPGMSANDREQAIRLPLVRQVFDVFGQATMLGVRPENQNPTPPAEDEAGGDDLVDYDDDLPPAGMEDDDYV